MIKRALNTRMENILLFVFLILSLKQILYGLCQHIIPSNLFTLFAIIIILITQIRFLNITTAWDFYKRNRAVLILFTANALALLLFILSLALTSSNFGRLSYIFSLNIFWLSNLFLPPLLSSELNVTRFKPEWFFDQTSLFATYVLGSLFIIECIAVKLQWFDRLQIGYFLLGMERLYPRDLWGFLGNETQSTGIIAVSGLYLLTKYILIEEKEKKSLLYGWVIASIAITLGDSITTGVTFYMFSLLVLIMKYRRKLILLGIPMTFLTTLALYSNFGKRITGYFTGHKAMLAHFVPEFEACSLWSLTIGLTSGAGTPGCHAKEIHLLESYFHTNFLLLFVFLSILSLPFFRIKRIFCNKQLAPIFILYSASLALSVHYDFIAAWPAAFLTFISWCTLCININSGREELVGRKISTTLHKGFALSSLASVLFLVSLDFGRIKKLQLLSFAGSGKQEDIILNPKAHLDAIYEISAISNSLTTFEIQLIPLRYYQLKILLVIIVFFCVSLMISLKVRRRASSLRQHLK